VLDYLRRLHHDGTKRIDTWLIKYLGVADTPYARLVSYKWLLGAVGRVMQPGCKMDNVLILEGPQDVGKSRTLSTLFGQQWTTDANLNLADANTPIVMAGKWVIELAELDSLSKADSASAKRWITTQVDTFRPPYGRRAIDLPRQCVVAGTVNFDSYLKDESGNRRYWPVKVPARIDIAGLRADRDQIWAEAFALYCEWERASKEAPDGLPAPWVVMPAEKHLFEIEQEARYEGDVYESMIAQFLIGKRRVTVEEIMGECLKLEVSKMTKPEQRRVGAAMKSLGWIRKRESKGARQWYYTLPDPVVENPPVSPDGVAQAETDDDAPL
jgi:predicted P-loop ATPase